MAKQIDRGTANDFELGGEIFHRHIGMTRMFGPKILVKTGKRCPVIPGEDKSAIRKDAFGIDNVSDDLLYRPLAGCVSVICLIFIDATQQIRYSHELLLEKLHDLVAGDFADIADLIIGQFLSVWSSD